MIPNTLPEWEEYVAAIPNESFRDVAIAANTLTFVRTLQGEGLAGGDIVKILGVFAQRFELQGEAPPLGIPGEYLSYGDLLEAMAGGLVLPLAED
jgi:hypothetical protein